MARDSLGENFLRGHSRLAKGSRERCAGPSAATEILSQAFQLEGGRWPDLPEKEYERETDLFS